MFSEIKSVHFVGICGTAMATTAAALKQREFFIRGKRSIAEAGTHGKTTKQF